MSIEQTNPQSSPPRGTADAEPWIGTAAACNYLGISIPTIHRWVKAGRVKPRRTPTGEYRFRRSQLDEILS